MASNKRVSTDELQEIIARLDAHMLSVADMHALLKRPGLPRNLRSYLRGTIYNLRTFGEVFMETPLPMGHGRLTPDQEACGRAIHDQCMLVFEEHGLTAREGLEVMQSIMAQFVVFVREQLLTEGIAMPDRFLWQCIADITHALAHAPQSFPQGSDIWLHDHDSPHNR